MKKIILIALVVILLAGGGVFLLRARGASQARATGVVTTVTFWDGNPGPSRTPFLEDIIGWFHETQDRIRVEYVAVPQADYPTRLNVAIAGNAVPDTGEMRQTWGSGFIAQNALYNLDDMMRTWPDARHYDPSALDTARSIDPNRGLYFLPIRGNFNVFWYRVDRFAEKGLNPPETWDEFFTTVNTMTNLSVPEYGIAIRGGQGAFAALQTLMFSYAGVQDYFDPATGRAALRDPLMLEFLTRFVGLYRVNTSAGDVNLSFQAMVAGFGSGVVNMIYHNLGSLDEHTRNLPAGTFATASFPRSVKGHYNLMAPDYSGYAVMQNSRVRDAAVEWLQYLCGERGTSHWTRSIGELPPRLDVLQHEWVRNAAHLRNVTPVFEDPSTAIAYIPTYLPEYQRIRDEGDAGFQAVLLGEMTPAAYLDQMATALEEANQRFQAHFAR